MTPFLTDVCNVACDLYELLLEIICYFIGHNWGAWEDYADSPIGALRKCKRCGEYEHDSQRRHGGQE